MEEKLIKFMCGILRMKLEDPSLTLYLMQIDLNAYTNYF